MQTTCKLNRPNQLSLLTSLERRVYKSLKSHIKQKQIKYINLLLLLFFFWFFKHQTSEEVFDQKFDRKLRTSKLEQQQKKPSFFLSQFKRAFFFGYSSTIELCSM